MKSGLSSALALRLHRPNEVVQYHTEVIAQKAEDVRNRRAEFEAAGVTRSNVQAFDLGGLRLSGTSPVKIDQQTSNGYITDLNDARPLDVLSWELDASIGGFPVLTEVQLYLNRRQNGGQPVFDGTFVLRLYRVATYGRFGLGNDFWELAPVSDDLVKPASEMTSDTELVTFSVRAFAGNTPGHHGIPITAAFVPQRRPPLVIGGGWLPPQELIPGRMVVAVLSAVGGTNSNYGLGRDSTKSITDVQASKGTLRHRVAQEWTSTEKLLLGGFNPLKIDTSAPVGAIRCAFRLASYDTPGSITFGTTAKMDLGQSVQGTVEFIVLKEATGGSSIVVEARVQSPDAWVAVKDGQHPADVGLAVSQSYEMRATLTANATADTSPALFAIGIRDAVVYDVSRFSTLSGFGDAVDPFSGEVRMQDGTLVIEHTGKRDYEDIATRLITENDFVDLEVRAYVKHPDLARADWLLLDLWRVEDYDDTGTQLTLYLLSLLEQLRGVFPQQTGNLTGWVLKNTNSDLTGGADWSKELSEGTVTSGGIAASIAASATEDQKAFTLPGVPNMAQWPSGDATVVLNVTVANSNIQLSVALARVNAAGSQQQISRFTDEQQGTSGIKTFTLAGLTWTAGAITDRLALIVRMRNTVGSAQSITLQYGTTNAQVQAPWFPLTQLTPKQYNQQSVQTIYEDWRDNVVALQERYRGASPPSTELLTNLDVLDAEGKRTLERIAFAGGYCPISSQGVIKAVALQLPEQQAVGTFLLRETDVSSAGPGLRGRVPELFVRFGYNTLKPNDYAGTYQIRHAVALDKFSYSRIDNPKRSIEDDITRWFPDAGVAYRVGVRLVRALGTGFIRLPVYSSVPHPEYELCDAVVVETDRFAARDPNTGEQRKGTQLVFGQIIARRGLDGRRFDIWVRAYANMHALTATVAQRLPHEAPFVVSQAEPDPADHTRVFVRLKPWPSDATVKYIIHDATVVAPERNSPLWLTYTGPVVVTRATTADKLVSFHAVRAGVIGPQESLRIPPNTTPVISDLQFAQGSASPPTTLVSTAIVDQKVRKISWYRRSGATPVSGGVPDPAYFTKKSHVDGLGEARFFDGSPGTGGLTDDGKTSRTGAAPTYATGTTVWVAAVPFDINDNPGDLVVMTHVMVNSLPGQLTAITWTLNRAGTDCSTDRRYDFDWTTNGSVQATDVLTIFSQVNTETPQLIATIVDPGSTLNSDNNITLPSSHEQAGHPEQTVVFTFELRDSGGVLLQSGTIARSGGGEDADTFEGETCFS